MATFIYLTQSEVVDLIGFLPSEPVKKGFIVVDIDEQGRYIGRLNDALHSGQFMQVLQMLSRA